MLKSFIKSDGHRPGAAIFLSGSGSNAERLLESLTAASSWMPLVLVTDRPDTSRARELAVRFDLPLAALDIGEFYRRHGEPRVSLQTENGRRIRDAWTDELRRLLVPYAVDFGILAGFVPLSNITSDFPCLNIHPGDLTYLKDGQRFLVGLHQVPLERALTENLSILRSSVIVAQPYTGQGGEMDSGPLLGISGPVPTCWEGHTRDEIAAVIAARPMQRPSGGYGDLAARLAALNLERLKQSGDWVVFPLVVEEFAQGNYALDEQEKLWYRREGQWQQVITVEFDVQGGKRLVLQ